MSSRPGEQATVKTRIDRILLATIIRTGQHFTMEMSRYFYGKALDAQDFLAIRLKRLLVIEEAEQQMFYAYRPPRVMPTQARRPVPPEIPRRCMWNVQTNWGFENGNYEP